jgi:lipopolysaccharide export system protein LptA
LVATPKKTRTVRTTGLLIAIALALMSMGIVLYVALGNRVWGSRQAIPSNVIVLGAPDTPASEGLGPVKDARIQIARKSDPSELAAELVYASLDPVGNGYYALDKPQAWLFLRDARVVHVQAGGGRVKMAGRSQQPESGDLTNGVLVRVYRPEVLRSTASRGPDDPPFDPNQHTPVLVLFTPAASFDSITLEVRSDEPVTLMTPSVLFQGNGLVARGNEVRERIELLRTTGNYMRFNPNAERAIAASPSPDPGRAALSPAGSPPAGGVSSTPAATPSTAASSSAATSGQAAATAPALTQTLYRCLISDTVSVTNESRRLSADTLELWARLIDNKLPVDAIAPILIEETSASSAPSPAPAVTGHSTPADAPLPVPVQRPATTTTPSPAPAFAMPALPASVPILFSSSGAGDIVLSWTGMLQISPVLPADSEPVPDALDAGNHFAARFSADKPAGEAFITLTDTASDLLATCGSIDYRATTRELRLTGGSGTAHVAVDSPAFGRAVLASAKIDLGSGVAQASGAGVLALIKPDVDAARALTTSGELASIGGGLEKDSVRARVVRQLAWRDQADVQLKLERGRLTSRLELATFTGEVAARDGSSMLAGDFLRAEFGVPRLPSGAAIRGTLLKSLRLTGRVRASAGASSGVALMNAPPAPTDPSVRADQLDVLFAPTADGRESYPAVATAVGNALAKTPDAQIAASTLEARMVRAASGEIEWDTVSAEGAPVFQRTDGVFARADKMRVDARSRAADLTGATVTIGRGPTEVTASQGRIRLEDASGRVVVAGPGTFRHAQPDGGNPHTPSTISVNWTRGMVFDNTLGSVDCDGDVRFEAAAELASQKASGDQVRLQLTPLPSSAAAGPGSSPGSLGSVLGQGTNSTGNPANLALEGRRVLRAEAIGAAASSPSSKPASAARVEAYRYSRQADGQRRRDQVLFLESQRIIADDVQQTLSVPVAGFAIMRDERPLSPGHQADDANADAQSLRGTARLSWAGSMSFARSTGELSMQRDVELVHVPPHGHASTDANARGPLRLVATSMDARFGAPTGPSGTLQGAELRRAEATGAVYAEAGPSGKQVKLFADNLTYDVEAGSLDIRADQGNRVSVYDDRRPAPIVARRARWDLLRDRIEITEPMPIVAPR